MRPLHRDIRRQLERTVRQARIEAEHGARRKLTELGVLDARVPPHLSAEERTLRVSLRAHARALGDEQRSDGAIVGERLIREVAYEHWHRALFARFLAESAILLEPEHRVTVSMSELDEIARDEGKDPFELAADWAAPMLPAIFRADDPALALRLPPETRAALRDLVAALPRAIFEADDSLGWAYQFWQTDEKERVNNDMKAGKKVGADELPAVTQLFTEDYMVLFLLENTLGAWWAARVLARNPELARTAEDEAALRAATSPPGWSWTYLRFVRKASADGEPELWRPAAGEFAAWPRATAEITILDPCMGSGHFLVFALPMLAAMRAAEEGMSTADAVLAVLRDNLFGLEIDARCTQIAAFALALAAWKRLGGWRELPPLNLACSGLALGMSRQEWLELAESMAQAWGSEEDLLGVQRPPLGEAEVARDREGLGRLYDLFRDAPILGSLIDPARRGADIFATGAIQLRNFFQNLAGRARGNPDALEATVAAQGMLKAADLLFRDYTLICTNVPFLGRSRMSDPLRRHCDLHYPNARADLGFCLVERYRGTALTQALVFPSSIWSLHSFVELRRAHIARRSPALVALLGSGAFETISGRVVNVSLSVEHVSHPHQLDWLDVIAAPKTAEKASGITSSPLIETPHDEFRRVRDYIMSPYPTAGANVLERYADIYEGTSRGDSEKYDRYFWELSEVNPAIWTWLLNAPETTGPLEGRSIVFRWERGNGELARDDGARIRGRELWGKVGVFIARTSNLQVTLHTGEIYAQNGIAISPRNAADLDAIFAFLSSEEFKTAIRQVNQKPLIPSAIVKGMKFDAAAWRATAPSLTPFPAASELQWLYSGNLSNTRRGLQVATARMLGYRWPRQTGSSFMDFPAIDEPDAIDRSGHVDADGIVCLAPLYGEPPAVERLRGVLSAAFGDTLDIGALLAAEAANAHDLGDWLRNEFAEGHTKLFQQRPFIWQIWDGLADGFSALVNYHRLCAPNGEGRRVLEKLRDTYLGEWIAVQQRRLDAGEAAAEARVVAARHLSEQLSRIIEGEPPFDIFVRWKPLAEQPIGWAPDIDDGVRINIRPFLTAKTKNGRQGLLRYRPPGIKWGKDRGAEPKRAKDAYPWFWGQERDVDTIDFMGGNDFVGARLNGFHYTRATKEAARRKAKAA